MAPQLQADLRLPEMVMNLAAEIVDESLPYDPNERENLPESERFIAILGEKNILFFFWGIFFSHQLFSYLFLFLESYFFSYLLLFSVAHTLLSIFQSLMPIRRAIFISFNWMKTIIIRFIL